MAAELRILHTECSPNWGGEEASILRVALAQRDRLGHRVWIGAPPGSALLERSRQAGLPTLPLAMRGSLNPAATLKVWRLVRGERIDLIHCHGSRDNWTCLPLQALGVPIIRWRHISSPVPARLSRSFIYRHGSRRLIAVGEAIRAALIGRNGVDPARIESLPAGVDLDLFHPGVDGSAVRAAAGCSPGDALFGLVAMLRPEKGHRYFIEAAARVAERLPEARFLVVGEETNPGSMLPQLEVLVGELGLTGKVVFAGWREDMPQVMAALDALVLPSTGVEGLPQVIQQAMATARPVVATPVGSVAQLVRHGETGLLVPAADAAALAAAMLRLAADRELAARLAAAGHELAVRELSAGVVIDRLEAIQAEVLGRASHHGRRRL